LRERTDIIIELKQELWGIIRNHLLHSVWKKSYRSAKDFGLC